MNTCEFFGVDPNVFQLYETSSAAKNLLYESKRVLKAEDRSWNFRNPKSLVDIVLECIASHFEIFMDYFDSDDIPEKFKIKLMSLIPTNLPLNLSFKLIPDGIYWKRSCLNTWPPGTFMMNHKNSWKRTYIENFLQNYLENVYPIDMNLVELKELLNMIKNDIYSLNIEHLTFDLEADKECEIKHIDLCFILSSLPNLEVFKFTCGTKQFDVEFSRDLFEITIQDCINIGQGLTNAFNLLTLKMHRCNLNQSKLFPIIDGLKELPLLREIEFLSCNITDNSMPILLEFLSQFTSLEELSLVNNEIGPDGAIVLATYLKNMKKLKILNMRLNFILDKGGSAILTAASVHHSLHNLNLAGCEITSASIESLLNLILNSKRILEIDLSVNNLDLIEDVSISEAVLKSDTLQRLDLRMNTVDFSQQKIISEKLANNRKIKNKWHF